MSSSSTNILVDSIFPTGSELLEPLKDTDKWINSALRFNNSKYFLLLTSLIILQVIPSLLGYVIIVPILTVLPGPSQRTNFDSDLTLRRSSSSYHFSLNSKLDFEFVSYPWFQ